MLSLYILLPILFLSVESGKVLVYSPSISRSHLISNGRIADTLVDAGHEVVMFIPEYEPIGEFTGTKKAKVMTMKGFTKRWGEFEGIGEYLLSVSTMGFMERYEWEISFTDICDGEFFFLKKDQEVKK
ncbi:unnamed protein product [Caenorhabditis brenneri]